MAERSCDGAVQVLPDRLYWASLSVEPQSTSKLHYFSIDDTFVYAPFNHDFGPLNLSMTVRYCRTLQDKLADPALKGKRIVHYCSRDPAKRANSACLICAYQVIVLRKTAESAYEPFRGIHPPFLPFRDASSRSCAFGMTIADCLEGLEEGVKNGWLDWRTFDVDSYDFFSQVENGDMNWIIPDAFLAFAGPSAGPVDEDGCLALCPADYVPAFRDVGVSLVVRLNERLYDRREFTRHGIGHVDLHFPDGSCPSGGIISDFLHATRGPEEVVAVHCKAGLGRTATLIGLRAMAAYRMPARAFIGWSRLCRPGSVLGAQQQFLVDMQHEMFQAGAARRPPAPVPSLPDGERALALQVESLQLSGGSRAELLGDVGQGRRLRQAKRSHRARDERALSRSALPPLFGGVPPAAPAAVAAKAKALPESVKLEALVASLQTRVLSESIKSQARAPTPQAQCGRSRVVGIGRHADDDIYSNPRFGRARSSDLS